MTKKTAPRELNSDARETIESAPSRVPTVGLASEAALHENRWRFAPLRFKSCLKNGTGCSPTDRGVAGSRPARLGGYCIGRYYIISDG
jgi:hypothetical protein